MSNINVLISGSGIAGSVFAFWLLRAYPNANITIVERDPALRLTGASVDIRSSAVDIIKWMNVEQQVRAQSTNEEGMQVVDVNGKPVAAMRATGNSDVQSLTSEFEIFRGALTKIFMDPVLDRVELVLDESVERFEQFDDGVDVTFARSGKTHKYDLLVAADGLGSKIRGMLMGGNSQDYLVDEGVHVAFFTVKKDLLRGGRLAQGLNGVGGRAVFLRPDPDPAGRTRANLMKVTMAEDVETKQKLNTALREGNDSYMDLMDEMYRDMGWLVPDVLQAMRETDDFYCSRYAQVKLPKLHEGRVVLVGDAGYATPGIGTSLAIIGGYVLAGELLTHTGDIKTALMRYEESMLPFATSFQTGTSGAMQFLNPQTQWGIYARNMLFSFVTWTRLDRLAIAISAMLGFTEKKFPLPDYQWPVEQK